MPPKTLRSEQTVLDSGLTVIAVRKPGVPLVEMRLRVPFLSAKAAHPAQATLLGETLLTGAGSLDRAGLAAAVQALGADVHASVDADRLVVSGNALASNLEKLLGRRRVRAHRADLRQGRGRHRARAARREAEHRPRPPRRRRR